jgi:hypothetical protein
VLPRHNAMLAIPSGEQFHTTSRREPRPCYQSTRWHSSGRARRLWRKTEARKIVDSPATSLRGGGEGASV